MSIPKPSRLCVWRSKGLACPLGLTDDLADGIIANQIIELAKTGELNPDLLCEAALKKLQEHLYSD
jgi:hypothetical protein